MRGLVLPFERRRARDAHLLDLALDLLDDELLRPRRGQVALVAREQDRDARVLGGARNRWVSFFHSFLADSAFSSDPWVCPLPPPTPHDSRRSAKRGLDSSLVPLSLATLGLPFLYKIVPLGLGSHRFLYHIIYHIIYH